ncbi:hypothetical protein [Nocardioides sp. GXQ0305]|uniref:hypothetical protein n=1 Tax=Nocardioides sp. GXQ0305 TaxID=3423912 RepID=UPI003D7CF4D3
MRPVRWFLAGLLWLLAGVVGLLGVVMSVTVILLPLGIPLLMLSRRLVRTAGALLVPKAVRHPGRELARKSSSTKDELGKRSRRALKRGRKELKAPLPKRSPIDRKAKKIRRRLS